MIFKFETTYIFKNTNSTVKLIESKIDITVKEISIDQIRTVFPFIRDMNELKFKQFEKRMESRGDKCFVAWIKDQPVHFSWVRISGKMGVSSANRTYNIPEDAVWIFDCRTSENFRGKRIYPHVIGYISSMFLKNKKAVYIDTSKSNIASSSAILKTGFQTVVTIYRWWYFQWSVPNKLP